MAPACYPVAEYHPWPLIVAASAMLVAWGKPGS